MKAVHPLGAVMVALSLAQINEILGIAASAAALAYTIWRWRKDVKSRR